MRFEVRDASDPQLTGRYDLVTAFETVHDMARPVEALRMMRGLLAVGGSVLIAGERVAEDSLRPVTRSIVSITVGASCTVCRR